LKSPWEASRRQARVPEFQNTFLERTTFTMPRKLVILTEGHTNPHTAKTASCLIRYCRGDVVALLDATQQGKSAAELLGVGADVPVVGTLAEAAEATTLLLGIAPPGGKIPAAWRAVILEAIERGMDVTAGLHDFLSEDAGFVEAADRYQVTLTDVRKNDEGDIARRRGIRSDCLRILTVGHDCSVGKMVTSMELCHGLQRAGEDAHFIATGQTGILVSGDGCPVDRVVADFVSGAVEKMVLKHQHHEILVIEGQGSLVHPSYSGVTLGLMHGAMPHALILCYEIGRQTITGLDHLRIPPLARIKELNEIMASIFAPCPVIGISINSRRVDAQDAADERGRVRGEFGLPVCDVIRDGPDALVESIVQFKKGNAWREHAST
jgi:uncharacterized NAD-dependent epimerase/dehydratase family protein